MLFEAVLHLTARTRPDLRRLGLVGDAVALWSRANRQRRAWRGHEARCHAVVRQAVAELPECRTVLVLGSGLIRDVPLPFLAERFRRVVLIDAVHLLPARLKARRAGAEMSVADLTGASGWLAGRTAGRLDPLARWRDDPHLDLVVSANVLSQLPMAVESWLERRPTSGVPTGLPDQVVRWHIADLGGLPGRVCLLSDTSYRVVNRAGATLEQTDLLRGATLPAPDESWDWDVAPFGEIAREEAHIHRVHAYRDFRLA